MKTCEKFNLCFLALVFIVLGCMTSPALAVQENPANTTVKSMDASTDPILRNYGSIIGNVLYNKVVAGMYGSSLATTNFDFLNANILRVSTNGDNSLYGMYVSAISGEHKLSNTKEITVNGVTRTVAPFFVPYKTTGIYLNNTAGNFSANVDNSATLTASSTANITGAKNSRLVQSFGIELSGYKGKYIVDNTGNIKSTATSNSVDGTPIAEARGISISADGAHVINNNGKIESTSNTKATKVASGTAGSSRSIAFGIDLSSSTKSTISNVGTIVAKASGSGLDTGAMAYGIRARSGKHNVTNNESITAISNAVTTIKNYTSNIATAESRGIYFENASGSGTAMAVNNSSILAQATANSQFTDGVARARGIELSTSGASSARNTGDIIATALSDIKLGNSTATAYGMVASGNGTYTLTNSGKITVKATAKRTNTNTARAEALAYGMYAFSGRNTLNNTGAITASASAPGRNGHAYVYEAYGDQNYNVGTWATTLRNWSSSNAVFGADYGKKVTFNNAKLILRAGTAAQGFKYGKVYEVAKMVAYDAEKGFGTRMVQQNTITGSIASVQAEVGYLKAVLIDGKTNKPKVKLEKNSGPSTVPGTVATKQGVAQVQGQMLNIGAELRHMSFVDTQAGSGSNVNSTAQAGHGGLAAGSHVVSKKWQVFLNPYANFTNNNNVNYDGSNMGITGGVNRRITDNFAIGAHFDFNSANYYADVMDMDAKSTSYAFGLHGSYNFTPEWYVRGRITGILSQTDSNYTESAGALVADSTYNSNGFYASLNTGYVWKFNENHSLTPEIGLGYMSIHTSAYDINWGGPAAVGAGGVYDISYDDNYYNAFYGNIKLDWRSEWELENDASIALIAGLGLRQKLNSGDLESTGRMLGSSFSTSTTEDTSTWLGSAGVEFRKGDFSVSLNYNGYYGAHQTTHGGNVMFTLDF